MRRLVKIVFLLASLIVMTGAFAVTAHGSDIEILFENSTVEEIAPGVYHHRVRQVTTAGFRDIHVLTAPVNNPNIVIGPAESANEHGLRETLTTLINDNDAAAGINADFFGLANIRTASFGPTVQDGELISVGAWLNLEEDLHAALYIQYPHNPFIAFPQTQIEFLNNGESHIEIQAINKVTDMMFPIIINRHAMDNTEQLDERFEGLFKIIVENGFITRLSENGETVDVPENGFLVVMSEASAGWVRQFYAVGQTAQLNVTSNVDFSTMTQVIGGGGRILYNGEFAEEGLVIAGRQPRTAVGISEDDGGSIIMVVIDGRGHSIGATHEETAEIMRSFGAFNAMMMDGGGSSTMGVSTVERPAARVVNTPSEGVQRRVINALAVYNRYEAQEPLRIDVQAVTLSPNPNVIYVSVPSRIDVFAVDGYFNRIDIPFEDAAVAVHGENLSWDGNYLTASAAGTAELTVYYAGMMARRVFEVRSIVELVPSAERITVEVGESQWLGFRGVDNLGWRSGNLQGVEFRVSDPELGSMQGSTFAASGEGMGYIEARFAGVIHHIAVAVVPSADDEEDEVPAPNFSGLTVPANSRFEDYLRRDLSGEPPYSSFDIVAVGRTAVPNADSTPVGFADADAAARASFTRNLTRGLLVGQSNWDNDIAPIYRWNSNYHVHRQGNVIILQMSAADGGFFRTNPQQRQNFARDIRVSDAEHVIVMMDSNPITNIPSGEREFFSEIMAEFLNKGMSVFVVSAQGEATGVTVRDGIRYIDLGSMWTSENTLNDAFALLRIRVAGGQMVYELQGVR
ncbi:MAG: phosphodiester glycosidase family protein [Defluviitaleaceae bacterium]|nr:phosphodiester glycosidase family protein [Defluviitaleaceae bacterium]